MLPGVGATNSNMLKFKVIGFKIQAEYFGKPWIESVLIEKGKISSIAEFVERYVDRHNDTVYTVNYDLVFYEVWSADNRKMLFRRRRFSRNRVAELEQAGVAAM